MPASTTRIRGGGEGGIYKGGDLKNTLQTEDTGQTITRFDDKLNLKKFKCYFVFLKTQ
jgi:hypothetical protein